jgi:3',5'-cyclic-AMP phosphodiesterase
MPAIFDQRLPRRRFLQTSVKALALGAALSRVGHGLVAAANSSDSLRLALLSDLHIAADLKSENRKFFPAENLKRAVEQVLQVRPQAALVNGDIARLTGELEDYQAAKSLLGPLAEQCPIYLALGNHDDRDRFKQVFPPVNAGADRVKDKHVLVVEEPFLRLIVLDSLLYPNKTPGLLGKAQRDWLDKYLANADARPTILFVHHTLGEGDGELLDADALYRIVGPYAKVKAIFYGHSHQYNYRMHHGIHLVNLPAVGYNFADREPVGWVDARFSSQGVDLTLRALGGDTRKDGETTSLVWRNS